jgi:hypothetical protein
MSGESSSEGKWYTRLEPPIPPEQPFHRADDPRLGDIVEYWRGGAPKRSQHAQSCRADGRRRRFPCPISWAIAGGDQFRSRRNLSAL